jgi:hypothetical protein
MRILSMPPKLRSAVPKLEHIKKMFLCLFFSSINLIDFAESNPTYGIKLRYINNDKFQ